jgi:hypothetical protein
MQEIEGIESNNRTANTERRPAKVGMLAKALTQQHEANLNRNTV